MKKPEPYIPPPHVNEKPVMLPYDLLKEIQKMFYSGFTKEEGEVMRVKVDNFLKSAK